MASTTDTHFRSGNHPGTAVATTTGVLTPGVGAGAKTPRRRQG